MHSLLMAGLLAWPSSCIPSGVKLPALARLKGRENRTSSAHSSLPGKWLTLGELIKAASAGTPLKQGDLCAGGDTHVAAVTAERSFAICSLQRMPAGRFPPFTRRAPGNIRSDLGKSAVQGKNPFLCVRGWRLDGQTLEVLAAPRAQETNCVTQTVEGEERGSRSPAAQG